MKPQLFYALLAANFIAGCSSSPMSTVSERSASADGCLGDQSLNLEDVDIATCPPLPELPESAKLGASEEVVSLGAWELGQTAEGEVYKYGSLSPLGTEPRSLEFYQEEDATVVNELNLSCWAKGYYRLRKLLQDPPASYLTLRQAGFQVRFFQFQTDLRNGPTGFREISSYRDHLIKWVTLIDEEGNCIQPTLQKFEDYVEAELQRRGIPPQG